MPGLDPGIHEAVQQAEMLHGLHPKSAVADFGNLGLQAGSNRLAIKSGHD
jgi:hypothetical protein